MEQDDRNRLDDLRQRLAGLLEEIEGIAAGVSERDRDGMLARNEDVLDDITGRLGDAIMRFGDLSEPEPDDED